MGKKLTQKEFAVLEHWSSFGQKGEPSGRRVLGSEWKKEPFQKPITSTWNIVVPISELAKLVNGFAPREMEDKWFVYADGPDVRGDVVVHMFRSWTGYKMVELRIKVPVVEDGEFTGAGSRITEIVWESDYGRYRNQTEEGAKTMAREVCNWVMDVKLL